jgi:hypothetical protein
LKKKGNDMIKPLTLLAIGVGGFAILSIGAGLSSLSIAVYGGMAIGFMLGAFIQSKEN